MIFPIHVLATRRLDRYFERGLGPRGEAALRAHVAVCARCRRRYERHLLLEAALPGGTARLEGRLWRGIAGRSAAPARPRPRAVWAGAGLLAAAGAAAAGVALAPAALDPARPAALERGPAPGVEPAIELPPALHVFRAAADGRGDPLAPGGRLGPDDGVLLAYSNPGARHGWLMVFAVDDRGEVFWYYPSFERAGEDPEAVPIVRGRSGVELGEEIRHALRPGPLRFHALFLEAPARVSAVEALVRAGALDRPGAASGALAGARLESVALEVAP
jgi:hypothetical protein